MSTQQNKVLLTNKNLIYFKMKKKYFLMGALALMLAVAGGYGVKTSMNSNNTEFSALVLANVEALAGYEDIVVTCDFPSRGRCWAWCFEVEDCAIVTGRPSDICF